MSTLNDARQALIDARDPDGKVLEWVNEQREAYGLPTLDVLPPNAPPGTINICTECPIAVGLRGVGHASAGMVGTTDWRVLDRRVSYPEFVREFVRAHDKDLFGTA